MMKNRIVKSVLTFLVATCLVIETGVISSGQQVFAAEEAAKPARPAISAKVTKAGNGVKITISKTSDAEGVKAIRRLCSGNQG